jgi:hypothetical protein
MGTEKYSDAKSFEEMAEQQDATPETPKTESTVTQSPVETTEKTPETPKTESTVTQSPVETTEKTE